MGIVSDLFGGNDDASNLAAQQQAEAEKERLAAQKKAEADRARLGREATERLRNRLSSAFSSDVSSASSSPLSPASSKLGGNNSKLGS